jgi:hypothetical protein
MSQQHDADRLIAKWLEYAAWWVREGSEKFEKWKADARKAGERARSDATLAGADPESAERAALDGVLQIPFDEPMEIEKADEVDEIIQGPDPDAWDLLRKLVSSAPNEPSILGYIGAGLFEDWVKGVRAEQAMADLLDLIRHDPKWRLVAEHCWRNPPAVEKLLESL